MKSTQKQAQKPLVIMSVTIIITSSVTSEPNYVHFMISFRRITV